MVFLAGRKFIMSKENPNGMYKTYSDSFAKLISDVLG
jgi:hypothetical protein